MLIKNRIINQGEKPAKAFNANPLNWRTHSKPQRDALNAILGEIGWVQNVIINVRTGNILDGHLRVQEAFERSPSENVPYIEVDLTLEEEKKILAVLDPIAAMATTDLDSLKTLLDLINFESDDLKRLTDNLLSTSDDQFCNPLEIFQDRYIAEVDDKKINQKWNVQLGDLWIAGNHRMLCGDSTDKAAAARLLDNQKSALLFTSPPYSDQRVYDCNSDLSVENLSKFIEVFSSFCEYQVINLGIKRVDYEIDEYWQEYIKTAKNCGYKFLSWNVWNRGQATSIGHQTAMFGIYHEWLFVFGEKVKRLTRTIPTKTLSKNRQKVSSRKKRRNVKGDFEIVSNAQPIKSHKQLGTVIEIPCANTIGESTHPAMFPVELPARHIEAMTKPNDIIVEPFAGSGTTIIACENLNRKCFAMEINPNYVAVALERIEKTFGIKAEKQN